MELSERMNVASLEKRYKSLRPGVERRRYWKWDPRRRSACANLHSTTYSWLCSLSKRILVEYFLGRDDSFGSG